MKDAPYPPKTRTSSTPAIAAKAKVTRRERSPEAEDRAHMEQEITSKTRREIEMLEARLAALKDKCGWRPHH